MIAPREHSGKSNIIDLAIEVEHLHKVFSSSLGFWGRRKRSVTAVEDVSFTVRKGELFGILGPNGAGKTTTIKMLSTLLLPTSGTARVLGLDVVAGAKQLRPKIGFTFGGQRGLYTRLSALDNLRYFAELYGLDPDFSRQQIPRLFELMGLAGREHDRVETYSSGMHQRLHLARVMLHDPDVLFLDEPTVGIDPVGARALRQIVKDLVGLGKTIILTTHYMFEAEALCNRIAVINLGKIIALGAISDLKRQVSGESVIEIQAPPHQERLAAQLQRFESQATLHTTEVEGYQHTTIRTKAPTEIISVLTPLLEQQVITSLEVRHPTLEDVYVSLIQDGQHG
jgi:ABC-2 type transport system ATP-binding protein